MAYTLKTLVDKSVVVLTVEQVKENPRSEYNKREWGKIVDRYENMEATFITDGENIYVIYIFDGIRFLKEITYSSSLSVGGFSWGYFDFKNITVYSYEEGRIEDSVVNRSIMRADTLKDCFSSKRFYTKVF